MKRIVMMTLVLVFGLLVGLDFAIPEASAKDVIKIGMTNSFSGPLESASSPVWRGARVWEEWINEQGGIFVKEHGGKLPVKIQYYDDESNRENLIRLYERLSTTDNVDVLFAPYGSGQTFVVAAIADKHQKLMISTTGSSHKIHEQGYKYIVQGIEKSRDFGRPYLDVIKKVDPKANRLAIVWEDHLFPKTVALEAEEVAKELGFNIIFIDKFPFGARDVTPVLTKVKQLNPDHVYISANIPGTVLAIRQAREVKLNPRSIGIIDNGMYYFREALTGKILHGVMGPVEWDISGDLKPEYGFDNKEFDRRYKNLFPNHPYDNHTPMGVNAGLLLMKAIEMTGTLDSKKLREAFCTMRVSTLVGSQAFECDTGKMKDPADGGKITLLTQYLEDGSTKSHWPPPFFSTEGIIYPKPKW